MRGMRALRNFKTDRCYHLISRIANRAFYLTDEERTRFVERLWRVAKFSGIEVLAYCLKSNHFHLLVHLPEAPELSDGELFDRIAALYSGDRLAEIRKEWGMYARLNDEAGRKRFRERFLRRMYDVSAFMKTLKQNAAMSYNCRSVHTGTMWESRFRVREYMPDEKCKLMNVAEVSPCGQGKEVGLVSYSTILTPPLGSSDLLVRRPAIDAGAQEVRREQGGGDGVSHFDAPDRDRLDLRRLCASGSGLCRGASCGCVPYRPRQRRRSERDDGEGRGVAGARTREAWLLLLPLPSTGGGDGREGEVRRRRLALLRGGASSVHDAARLPQEKVKASLKESLAALTVAQKALMNGVFKGN